MKRKDLIVGQEYGFSRSQGWQHYLTSVSKVTLLDAGVWEKDEYFGYRSGPGKQFTLESGDIVTSHDVTRGGKAQVVWVKREHIGYQGEPIVTIPLSQVKAPWAEVEQMREDAKAEQASSKRRQVETMRTMREVDTAALHALAELERQGVAVPDRFLKGLADYETHLQQTVARAEIADMLTQAFEAGKAAQS